VAHALGEMFSRLLKLRHRNLNIEISPIVEEFQLDKSHHNILAEKNYIGKQVHALCLAHKKYSVDTQ
jgi:hypothetical protein